MPTAKIKISCEENQIENQTIIEYPILLACCSVHLVHLSTPPLKIQPTPHHGEGSGSVQVEDCLLELLHQ